MIDFHAVSADRIGSSVLKSMLQLAWKLAVTVTMAVSPLTAQAQSTLFIESVTVLDGTGGPAQPDMTVVIADTKFSVVMPTQLAKSVGLEASLQAEGQIQRIDGRGKFLIPGLMDMHVHLKGGVTVSRDGLSEANFDRALGIEALHSYLYSGVTSIYDAGNIPEYIFSLRADERSGKIIAPRIFATGGIVTAPDSHGSGAGASLVDSWPEAIPVLEAHIARSPDVLKMTLEERGWGARPLIPLLDVNLMQKIIEYYNDRGIRTTVHASSELRARQAIFAGIDSLAHPVIQGPISDSFAQLMAAKKMPMMTTLTIGENYSRLVEHPEYLDQPLYQQALSSEAIGQLKSEQRNAWKDSTWTWWMKLMTPVAQNNIKQVHDAGGVVVLGTDRSIGPAVHREMELLVAAGIQPGAVLRMATLNGAIFLGKQAELGSIAVAKQADAVLLGSNPLDDVQSFKDIELVIKAGVIIDRDAL